MQHLVHSELATFSPVDNRTLCAPGTSAYAAIFIPVYMSAVLVRISRKIRLLVHHADCTEGTLPSVKKKKKKKKLPRARIR